MDAWCDGTSCSIEFASIPDGDNYMITVTPLSEYNNAGEPLSLHFSKGTPKVEAVLISPKAGSVVSKRPLFRWSLAEKAYEVRQLSLKDGNGVETVYSDLSCEQNGVNCENGEAFFSPEQELPAGAYTVKLSIPTLKAVSEAVAFTVK